MKKIFFFVGILVSMLMISSCSVSSKLDTTSSAVISQGNFKMVRPITREYQSTHVFGFGGQKVREGKEHAIISMSEELKPNQALAYINVTESKAHFIPYVFYKQSVTVSAIIIEYE